MIQNEPYEHSNAVKPEDDEDLKIFKVKFGDRNGESVYQLSLEIIGLLECSTRALTYRDLEKHYRNRYDRNLDFKKSKLALQNTKIKVVTIGDLNRKERAKKLKYLSGLGGSTRIFYISDDQLEKLKSM